jgi:hypothetical protein
MKEEVLDDEAKPKQTDDHQDDRELMMISPEQVEFQDRFGWFFPTLASLKGLNHAVLEDLLPVNKACQDKHSGDEGQ